MKKDETGLIAKGKQLVAVFNRAVEIIENARRFVGRTADFTMCLTYFELGRIIIEQEQDGQERAKYGTKMIAGLSELLNKHFGKGFSQATLKNARQFYHVYCSQIGQLSISELQNENALSIRQSMISEFKVSWTHYLVLMRIENPAERAFYEIEAINENRTVEKLKREYHSSLYERLALSKDKLGVMELSRRGQIVEKPPDILKNPLVLEFLGMKEHHTYAESDLESAIIDKMSDFLLELGKGFLFEARQKRFTYDEENFYVDLVFYNRKLKCYVLIDIKTQKLKHQDLGQMQMYVNYFDRNVREEGENPTIGILLCKDKNNKVVELTLPKDANIYAQKYSLYLPDKELLQSKLAEWVQEFEGDSHV